MTTLEITSAVTTLFIITFVLIAPVWEWWDKKYTNNQRRPFINALTIVACFLAAVGYIASRDTFLAVWWSCLGIANAFVLFKITFPAIQKNPKAYTKDGAAEMRAETEEQRLKFEADYDELLFSKPPEVILKFDIRHPIEQLDFLYTRKERREY